MKKKLYHATPRRLRIGNIVSANGVCHMTDKPMPHYTIFDNAYKENWHIYEVIPIGDICFDNCWDAWITNAATIKKYIGQAKGIIGLNRWKKYQEDKVKENYQIPGSAARKNISWARWISRIR